MKQLNTIASLKNLIPTMKGIEVALLYGSFGRKEATPNSDVDLQLLVNDDFDSSSMIDELYKEFVNDIQYIMEVTMRNKVVVYFKSQPKVEFAICRGISEIDRNYLGSEIANIEESVLYEKNPKKYDIVPYLHHIVNEYKENKNAKSNEKMVIDFHGDNWISPGKSAFPGGWPGPILSRCFCNCRMKTPCWTDPSRPTRRRRGCP